MVLYRELFRLGRSLSVNCVYTIVDPSDDGELVEVAKPTPPCVHVPQRLLQIGPHLVLLVDVVEVLASLICFGIHQPKGWV